MTLYWWVCPWCADQSTTSRHSKHEAKADRAAHIADCHPGMRPLAKLHRYTFQH